MIKLNTGDHRKDQEDKQTHSRMTADELRDQLNLSLVHGIASLGSKSCVPLWLDILWPDGDDFHLPRSSLSKKQQPCPGLKASSVPRRDLCAAFPPVACASPADPHIRQLRRPAGKFPRAIEKQHVTNSEIGDFDGSIALPDARFSVHIKNATADAWWALHVAVDHASR